VPFSLTTDIQLLFVSACTQPAELKISTQRQKINTRKKFSSEQDKMKEDKTTEMKARDIYQRQYQEVVNQTGQHGRVHGAKSPQDWNAASRPDHRHVTICVDRSCECEVRPLVITHTAPIKHTHIAAFKQVSYASFIFNFCSAD